MEVEGSDLAQLALGRPVGLGPAPGQQRALRPERGTEAKLLLNDRLDRPRLGESRRPREKSGQEEEFHSLVLEISFKALHDRNLSDALPSCNARSLARGACPPRRAACTLQLRSGLLASAIRERYKAKGSRQCCLPQEQRRRGRGSYTCNADKDSCRTRPRWSALI